MGFISAQQTRYSHLITWFIMLAILLFSAGSTNAGTVFTQCNDCHGMPPKDAARTGNPDFRSNVSATVGNHQNHLPVNALASDCEVCHWKVVSASDHQDGQVNMAAS